MSTQPLPTRKPRTDAPASVERVAALVRMDGAPVLQRVDLAFVAEAHAQGMCGIVRQAIRAHDMWSLVDDDAKDALDAEGRRLALGDRYFRRQATRAVAALRRAGIPAVVFKGEAMARTYYSPSHLRPRCDTDVLVQKRDVAAAGRVLAAIGYRPVNSVARDAIQSQQMFTEAQGSMRHVIDLHWDVTYRTFFKGIVSFDELSRGAIEFGDPASGFRVPHPVNALLLACLHRVAHHENSTRLIWLYDIALLADRLDGDQWEHVRRLAVERSLCDVCATGIELATTLFGCSGQTATHAAALRALADERREASRAYITARGGPLNRIVLDACDAGSLSAAFRVLAGHAFPDAEYMRCAFGARGPVSLAGSYVYRAARGLRRMVM